MNLLTLTRLVCNIMLLIAAVGFLGLALAGQAPQFVYLLILGALAVLGGCAQFAVSVLRPRSIQPAWDEQTVAAHRGSYQFGYWAALLGFWTLLITGNSDDFIWLGVVLVCAPSVWMVVATMMGRAG